MKYILSLTSRNKRSFKAQFVICSPCVWKCKTTLFLFFFFNKALKLFQRWRRSVSFVKLQFLAFLPEFICNISERCLPNLTENRFIYSSCVRLSSFWMVGWLRKEIKLIIYLWCRSKWMTANICKIEIMILLIVRSWRTVCRIYAKQTRCKDVEFPCHA